MLENLSRLVSRTADEVTNSLRETCASIYRPGACNDPCFPPRSNDPSGLELPETIIDLGPGQSASGNACDSSQNTCDRDSRWEISTGRYHPRFPSIERDDSEKPLPPRLDKIKREHDWPEWKKPLQPAPESPKKDNIL